MNRWKKAGLLTVAAEIEKLDLYVGEEEVNTKEEAAAYVEEAVNAILPAGFELLGTPSDAKKAGESAFKAAENGTDGFWKYDVTITAETEKDATPSTPANARRKPRSDRKYAGWEALC